MLLKGLGVNLVYRLKDKTGYVVLVYTENNYAILVVSVGYSRMCASEASRIYYAVMPWRVLNCACMNMLNKSG